MWRRSPNVSTSPRSKLRFGAHVAPAGVLVCLRIGVESDDLRGGPGEDLRAVALATGHIEHPPAPDSLGDPLVDRQVAAKPVVLGRDVGQRALTRELERGDPRRLILLNVGVHWHGRQGNVTAAMEASTSSATRPRDAEEIRNVNTRYHDVAAAGYDAKWGIDFGPVGQGQVIGKLRKLLGGELDHGFKRSLEIGAGTGYFSLNLLQAGVVESATCTDISPGMVTTLAANAERLGLQVSAAQADAESLPFADESFDLVLGHAVLHHLPDLSQAFAEFHRVLAPGGRIAFAGEPSRFGDRLAGFPKRRASALAPAWRSVLRAGSPPPPEAGGEHNGHDHALEHWVDIHAFSPADLSRHAQRAGFTDTRVRGEELVANWFGWFNRALEASAEPRRRADALASVRLSRLPAAAAPRSERVRAAAAPGDLLQPAADGAQAARPLRDRPPVLNSTGHARAACPATFPSSRWGSSRCLAS